MRKLKSEDGKINDTKIMVLDGPGHGGACHEYIIDRVEKPVGLKNAFAKISFQNGAIKEFGVNGCTQEDLLAIVIDRLECFQAGDFACEENSLALKKVKEALYHLNQRTQKRVARGVEGKNIK